jgi:hypothetical protein
MKSSIIQRIRRRTPIRIALCSWKNMPICMSLSINLFILLHQRKKNKMKIIFEISGKKFLIHRHQEICSSKDQGLQQQHVESHAILVAPKEVVHKCHKEDVEVVQKYHIQNII